VQTAMSSSRRRWLVPFAFAAVAIRTFVAFWIGGRPALGGCVGRSVDRVRAFCSCWTAGDTIRMLA